MIIKTAISFSSAVQRLVCRFSGLRLRAPCKFQAFLASSACTVSATSYHFSNIAPPPWRSAFAQFAPVVKLWRSIVVAVSNPATGLPHKGKKLIDVLAVGEPPAVVYPASKLDSVVIRASMESAGPARQSLQVAGNPLQGFSALHHAAETRLIS